MEQFFKRLAQIVYVVVAVVVIAGGFYFCVPQIQQLNGLEEQKRDFQQRIDARDRDIRTMRQNQESFRVSPSFIERLARKENRVAPDETVFIFEE